MFTDKPNDIQRDILNTAENVLLFDQKSLATLFKTIEYAKIAHQNQLRKSNEPYIVHPLWIARYLANKKFDLVTMQASLLHDVPEDTNITLQMVKNEFGSDVANLVDGVTTLGKIRLKNISRPIELNRQIETLKKMFLAMSKDIRVIIIKLVDRLHNMLTLEFVNPEKRIRIAEETLDIYAQIACRLGMGEIESVLQDLSFPYILPKEYPDFIINYRKAVKKQSRYFEKIKKQIIKKLVKNNIKAVKVYGRIKSEYSTYIKIAKQNINPDKLQDLIALRVIVENKDECYKVLGIMHNYFKPVADRFTDYISQPKPNGYQSLHTTVFGPEGIMLEIQIRTETMHEQAENGIAAHWYYSEQKNVLRKKYDQISGKSPEKKLKWLQELAKFQGIISDPQEFANSMKIDFFSDRIFVYTPTGDVKDLPQDATPIDFAFSIHSELGYSMVGAKINGKITQISTPLNSRDIVEILISKKSQGPKRDWLDIVKTANARYHIKKYLRNKEKV